MIWLAVFPTLTILNLALGDWLRTLTPVVRTFVLATIAVPIVIYGLMPQLHRLRGRLLTRIVEQLNHASDQVPRRTFVASRAETARSRMADRHPRHRRKIDPAKTPSTIPSSRSLLSATCV